MARFGVNNTLANPSYMGGLFEAARGVGASSGNRREREAKKRAAEEMNNMSSTLGMLQYQVQNAKTPEQAMQAQMLLENFKDMESKRSNVAEDRQFLKADRATAEAERGRGVAQEQAKARISVLENEAARLEREGQKEGAKNLRTAIGRIAAEAGVEVKASKDTSANRYLNLGGGKVFDSVKGEFLTDPTEAQKDAAGPEMAPKDFLSNIRQEQKDTERWKPEAYQAFLTEIPKEGVYASAEKHLTKANMVDIKKKEADASADAVADATRVIDNIDDMLAMAPDMSGGALGDVAAGVGQQVGSLIAGTSAQDLENKVDTLRANSAFDRLQKMRDNSKTGGALGQVSEKELKLLQDNLAALQPTTKSFGDNLMVVRNAYQRSLDIEMGPKGGSQNYQKSDDGSWLYIDPVSEIIYDYATGEPDPRYN